MNTTEPLYKINTCLGDLFSVAWMEDAMTSPIRKEKIAEQFNRARYRTYNAGIYTGSHVCQYGDIDITNEPVANYLSTMDVGKLAW